MLALAAAMSGGDGTPAEARRDEPLAFPATGLVRTARARARWWLVTRGGFAKHF